MYFVRRGSGLFEDERRAYVETNEEGADNNLLCERIKKKQR